MTTEQLQVLAQTQTQVTLDRYVTYVQTMQGYANHLRHPVEVVAAMIPGLLDSELREFVHVLTHLATQEDLQYLRATLQEVDVLSMCSAEMQTRMARIPQEEIEREAQLTSMQQEQQ